MLTSMRCVVDSEAGNDTPMIGCDQIGPRSVHLDLVNTQDVAAEKWVAPKKTDVKKLSPVTKTSLVRSKLLKQTLAPRHERVAPRRLNCQPGLVSVSGQCVPKLKK